MVLLATDTSGKHGSIALAQCERDSLHTLELVPLQGGTFSAELVPQIAALLLKHNLGKADIDGFAVVSGPGSFTGLRVGLAALKALADVLEKPIAAVSLLEVLAFDLHSASRGNRVLVALMLDEVRLTSASTNSALNSPFVFRNRCSRSMNSQSVPVSHRSSRRTKM